MKRFFIYKCVIVLFFTSFQVFSQTENSVYTTSANDTLSVTYIGGAGFLLESGSYKVMIDAVLTAAGVNGFIPPSAATVKSINDCVSPFNDIDLYLVGHAHDDHFDAKMMDNCMIKNSNAKLVCPQEVVNAIKATTGTSYTSYQNRVTVPVLDSYEDTLLTVNSIQVRATKFPSWSYHENGIIVYNVTLGNIKILHLMGQMLSNDKFSGAFNDPNTDLLLVTSNYLAGSTDIFEKSLHFKTAFVHHIYNYSAVKSTYQNKSKVLSDKGIPTYVLNSSLEKHKFIKENDSLIIDPVVITSLESTESSGHFPKVEVFPNPTDGVITILMDSQDSNKQKMVLSDISGKTVYSELKESNTNHYLDLSGFSEGIYFLKIIINESQVVTKKVIVK